MGIDIWAVSPAASVTVSGLLELGRVDGSSAIGVQMKVPFFVIGSSKVFSEVDRKLVTVCCNTIFIHCYISFFEPAIGGDAEVGLLSIVS